MSVISILYRLTTVYYILILTYMLIEKGSFGLKPPDTDSHASNKNLRHIPKSWALTKGAKGLLRRYEKPEIVDTKQSIDTNVGSGQPSVVAEKLQIAKLMKQRYHHFRRNLEKSYHPGRIPKPNNFASYSLASFPAVSSSTAPAPSTPPSSSFPAASSSTAPAPSTSPSTSPSSSFPAASSSTAPAPYTSPSSSFPATSSSTPSTSPSSRDKLKFDSLQLSTEASAERLTKQLRSAAEATTSQRFSGIPAESQPLVLLPDIFRKRENVSEEPWRSREDIPDRKEPEKTFKSPIARSFDPSIVVDFFNLLKLSSQSKRIQQQPELPRRSQRRGSTLFSSVSLTSKFESEEKARKRHSPVLKEENPTSISIPVNSKPSKLISKRAQYLEMPYTYNLHNISTSPGMNEDLSLYVSTFPSQPEPSPSQPEPSPSQPEPEELNYHPHETPSDETKYSEGETHTHQMTVPDLDLSQLPLPQGVRDSLRKYLKPLISSLKPLRKSVPGIPGLDYPILNVVPYTNFYCSNMPWPGFYADTEARCQTWHACDVDGRQSTFLCPNGTIFNQALMVCDWWYNTDCLVSPFLYPLNERLFGALKPEPVKPHTRITPELLDTIFV